jgi:hypothetical protein
MDLATGARFTMVRQDERSVRTIIVVMINRPLRSGMILQFGMEGSNLRHSLLLRSGTRVAEFRQFRKLLTAD